jgi:hypothetical protein
MKFVIKALDLLVSSNVYVSFGVLLLTWVSLDIRQIRHLELLGFVFFSTLFIYNFIRLIRVHPMLLEGDSTRHEMIFRYRFLLWVICIFSCLSACYFFMFIYKPLWMYLLPMAFVSLSYVIPVFKAGSKWIPLRDVPGLKIVLIATIWALVTEGLPSLLHDEKLNYLTLFERFLFVLAITIPFDVRDLRFDKMSLRTLPQLYGVQKAKWIGIFALLFAELILAYRFFFTGTIALDTFLAIYLTYEFSTVLLYKSHPKLPERFFTFGVEGMTILMGLLMLLKNEF